MRRYFPLIVVLSAIFIYMGRGVLFSPLTKSNPQVSPFPEIQSPTTPGTFPHSLTQEGNQDTKSSEPPITIRGKIRPRSSFFEEMQKAGICPGDIHRMVKDSRKTFNLKRVYPGQEYAVFKSSEETLDSLFFSLRNDKLLKVRRNGTNFHAVIDTLPYQITYHVTSANIHHSLFATLQSKGADPELASHLAIIFGWEIDFFKDIRTGDHFTILYEKRNYEDGRAILGRILAARISSGKEDHHAFGYQVTGRSWAYYDLEGKSLQKSLLRAPLRYSRITSSFSRRRLHPVTRHYRSHLGVDYAAPYGTPVYTTGDGTILAATYRAVNGKYVKIRHNRNYTTYYLHLSRFAKGIRKGRTVKQGQVIGYVGSTGLATGPHLDYRIKVRGRFVNPRTVDLPSKHPVPAKELPYFEKIRDAFLVKLLEGSSNGDEGKTIIVKEPTLQNDDQLPILY